MHNLTTGSSSFIWPHGGYPLILQPQLVLNSARGCETIARVLARVVHSKLQEELYEIYHDWNTLGDVQYGGREQVKTFYAQRGHMASWGKWRDTIFDTDQVVS